MSITLHRCSWQPPVSLGYFRFVTGQAEACGNMTFNPEESAVVKKLGHLLWHGK